MEVWYPTSSIVVKAGYLARQGLPETKECQSNPLIIRRMIMSNRGHSGASPNVGQRAVSRCMARRVLQLVPRAIIR